MKDIEVINKGADHCNCGVTLSWAQSQRYGECLEDEIFSHVNV